MDEKVIANVSDLTPIADALRSTTGSAQTYSVPELTTAAVNAINAGGGSVAIDPTLTQSGQAADAQAVGAALETKADADHIHTAAEVGADVSGAAASALNSAKSYTDTKISNLINSAPTTLDTLGEIATAMEENADVVSALESAVGNKANASDLTSHTENKSNPHGVTAAQISAVPTSRTVNGKALSANITLSASDVGADTSGAANTALTNAKAYTDAEITEWVGNETVSEQITNALADMEAITNAEIGEICGVTIYSAEGVEY